jgi:hypothetical protein
MLPPRMGNEILDTGAPIGLRHRFSLVMALELRALLRSFVVEGVK